MRNALDYLDAVAPVTRSTGLWTTRYVDVSNNNGAIDWRTVASLSRVTGITGAALKATEGAGFVDEYFAGWREMCAHVGLRVMPYHFARPDRYTPEQDAERFCITVGKIEPWEWRPMLDWETPPFHPQWAETWASIVRKRLGVAPVIYSYFAALNNVARRPILDGLVLAYPNGIPGTAPAPPPWRKWVAHQYSWNGHVDGINGGVDLNYSPRVRALLANPVRGLAYEATFRRRRRRA